MEVNLPSRPAPKACPTSGKVVMSGRLGATNWVLNAADKPLFFKHIGEVGETRLTFFPFPRLRPSRNLGEGNDGSCADLQDTDLAGLDEPVENS